MQREIKFRVRGRTTKIVLGYECLMPDITNDGWQWAKSTVGRDWEGGTYSNDYYIREQFTGLKDKNGREIYEGDVVRCGETVGMGRKLLKQVTGEVQYVNNIAGFGVEVQTGNNEIGEMTAYSWEISHFADFEVIGNIYESPELLK